jgi:hypothetical protein
VSPASRTQLWIATALAAVALGAAAVPASIELLDDGSPAAEPIPAPAPAPTGVAVPAPAGQAPAPPASAGSGTRRQGGGADRERGR